ncbi:MAG: TfoX/Sxy family protein [Maritimibacter sp.]|nr:TfoX/Sxy family protein [Maritimibacter sp.]
MATDPEFLAHVRDLFAELGEITTGRMFSGTALYVDGDVMFAAILGGTVWMKSDASTRDAFAAAGSRPFSYDRKTGRRVVPSLMSLPEAALDDPDEALGWAALSLAPARAAAEQKRREKARKAART